MTEKKRYKGISAALLDIDSKTKVDIDHAD